MQFDRSPAVRFRGFVRHVVEELAGVGGLFFDGHNLLEDLGPHPGGTFKVDQHAAVFTLGPVEELAVADLHIWRDRITCIGLISEAAEYGQGRDFGAAVPPRRPYV
jgi:hypothetical protein